MSQKELQQDQSHSKNLRILVVDDEADIVEFLVEVLHDYGHAVDGFHTGKSALERIDGRDAQYDVLVTDANMPDIKGAEVAEAFLNRFPKARVCLMSGHLDPDHILSEKLRNHQVHIQQKPFESKALIQWIVSG